MQERSLKVRALLYLYGSKNILGCTFALLGPVLLFAAVIDRGWLLITVGLYALGYVLGRKQPELERAIEDSLTMEQTMDRLDAVIEGASPHLTVEVLQSLRSIRTSVAEVLPRLRDSGIHNEDLFTVRQTVLRYLPETLANYVALPPAFRSSHPLKEGKTARELLTRQLSMLDAKMREIMANASTRDAQALIANGQFLEDKFRQPDFLAG